MAGRTGSLIARVAMGMLLTGSALIGTGVRAASPSPAGGRLDLDAVEVVGGPLQPIPAAEVVDLESRLGVQMPPGYRDFVTRFGDGYLCGYLVRVLPPAEVLAGLEEHRGMMALYWFWGTDDEPFGQDEAMRSILIADDTTGNRVLFSPEDPGRLYLLGRDAESVIVRPADVLAVADLMCRLGNAQESSPYRVFEPTDPGTWVPTERRAPIEPDLPPPDLDRPPREILQAYFDELAEVETWAIDAAGGPDVVERDTIPEEVHRRVGDEFEARLAAVYRRYSSPPVALVKRGATYWSVPPAHSTIEIVGEATIEGNRARFLTQEQHGGWTVAVTLERGPDGWRIVKEEYDFDPPF